MKHLVRFLAVLLTGTALWAAPLKVLIVDGQNNHDYKSTTPHLKKVLEDTGIFVVDVATTPPKGGDMAKFRPPFADYQVIVSNYNGERWSRETEEALVKFVRGGGGFVSVHAADNAFPDWPEYNQMIGLGGWGGRNQKWGPYLRLRDGKFVPDPSPGTGGSHGRQHAFVMDTRAPEHPIMRGLPEKWMHAHDELYSQLRGPAKHLEVLATAFADKSRFRGASGEHEPVLMAIQFGKGRVFHTTLGHVGPRDVEPIAQMNCVGFILTLQRGTEWAATGQVTLPVPADFPTADKTSVRTP